MIEGRVGDEPVELLVDTGAASTVVDLAWCRERFLPLVDTGRRGGGARGIQLPIYALDGVSMTLYGEPLQTPGLLALDLSHVNAGLTARGERPVGGVIGGDVLLRHRAVPDYGAPSLLLHR